jgi:GNAT superfamily N-acetyltransferase
MDGVPAGYVIYAPPSASPRAAELPTGPVSADAVLLTTMQVMPEFAGEGLGRMLAQAVVRDLTRRGVKAIEVFGEQRPGDEPGCLIPADFLRGVGFKTIRPHPRYPRLRMELRSAMTWKEDVEAALEQLLGTITIPMQASSVSEQPSRQVPTRS